MLEAYLLKLFQHEPLVFNTNALDLAGFEEIGFCGVKSFKCLILGHVFLFCAVDCLSFGEHEVSFIFVIHDIPQPRYELVGFNLGDFLLDGEFLKFILCID